MQALLLRALAAILILGAFSATGCKKADDSKPADSKPADSKAGPRPTTKTTFNIGQSMFGIQVPKDYDLSRLGEDEAAQLSWGKSGDSAVDPVITVSRANPPPADLAAAAELVSIGVFVETRTILAKDETAERWTITAKEDKGADGLGGFVDVNVWLRGEPMLWCRVSVKTTDEKHPLIAEALQWCTSLAPR
jgi:hypothetical protein